MTTPPPAARPDVRPELRLVLVGHVDHGKSTLIGRLLHDTGSFFEGKLAELEAVARRRGRRFEFANLLDALQIERDQNVTVDTTQIWFSTPSRRYAIIDAPGHREFVRHMITGAARADAALIVIDASEGVREQSRRHGYLLKLLGIRQVAVIVNKMDLVGFSQAAFESVRDEYRAFLATLGLDPVGVVPVSASDGDQVASASARLPWFAGPTVVELLDGFTTPTPPADAPMRLPVQGVYRFDHRRVVAGRVESGTLRVGDTVVFHPGGMATKVASLERWGEPPVLRARAGESIGLTLEDPLFVERGAIAAGSAAPPAVRHRFAAEVVWLGREPMRLGRSYRLRLATQETPCEIVEIRRAIDGATLEEIPATEGEVARDTIAEVIVRTDRPLVLDDHASVPRLGRFVLVDGLEISGGGLVLDTGRPTGEDAKDDRALVRSLGHVSKGERHARNRHTGAVVWLTGLSGAGKSTLANKLERALFDRGMQTFVLDGDNVRFGLNRDLGFSAADRAENIRRVAEVAKLFAEAGVIVVTAFISPYRSDRIRARQITSEGGLDIPFVEVFVDAPIEVCETRDPKGLYARARAGQIKQFTGVSDPYEPPVQPELHLKTAERSEDGCVGELLEYLLDRVDRSKA